MDKYSVGQVYGDFLQLALLTDLLVAKLYDKGISASQSIRQKLSAAVTNVGVAIGNII